MDKLSRYEMNLPKRLQEDIDLVNKTDPEEFKYCGYLMELNASINVCEIDESISRETAAFLRKKYFGTSR
ncbi:MAG: hypothetical protein ACI4M7_03085 [Succinivibrio sp.]